LHRSYEWLSVCLQSFDRNLQSLYDQPSPIRLNFQLRGSIHDQTAQLRSYIKDIRAFLTECHLPTRLTDVSTSQPIKQTTHERMCRKKRMEMKMLLGSHSHQSHSTDTMSDDHGDDECVNLLPLSFYFDICYLLDEYEAIPSTPSTSPSPTMSPTLTDLLDQLLMHTCEHWVLYQQMQANSEMLVQTAAVQPADGVHTAKRNSQRYIGRSQGGHTKLDGTSSFILHGVDYFMHSCHIHASSLLPQLQSSTRIRLYLCHPSLFEEQLMACLSKLCSQLDARLQLRAKLVHQRMADLMGVSVAPPANATHPTQAVEASPTPTPKAALDAAADLVAQTSPYIAFFMLAASSVSFDASVENMAASSWVHEAPLQLYRHAIAIAERICMDTNSDVAVDVLDWLNCAALSKCKTSGLAQTDLKEFYPPPVSPILPLLLGEHLSAFLCEPSHMRPFSFAHLIHLRDHVTAAMTYEHVTCQLQPTIDGHVSVRIVPTDVRRCLNHRRLFWLTLSKFRHWLDVSHVLYTHIDAQHADAAAPIIDAAVSLMAFHMAPADEKLFQAIRSLLLDARRRIQTRGETEMTQWMEQSCTATEGSPELRQHLLCLIAPLLPSASCASELAQRLMLDSNGWCRLLHIIQRWLCGNIMILHAMQQAHQRAKVTHPPSSSAHMHAPSANPVNRTDSILSPSSVSFPPLCSLLNFSSLVVIVHLMRACSKRPGDHSTAIQLCRHLHPYLRSIHQQASTHSTTHVTHRTNG